MDTYDDDPKALFLVPPGKISSVPGRRPSCHSIASPIVARQLSR